MCLFSKYYWHDGTNLLFGEYEDGALRGRGRFTLEDSIEVDVKGIKYGVIE
jgi:hypothetical protein